MLLTYAWNALALNHPSEYAKLVLDREMQAWADAENGFAMWERKRVEL